MDGPQCQPSVSLGHPIPPDTPHAVSVSFPTWEDTVARGKGDKSVSEKMLTGYPRNVLHLCVQKLVSVIEQAYAFPYEKSLLFPSRRVAEHCRSFMDVRSISTRLLILRIDPSDKRKPLLQEVNLLNSADRRSSQEITLYAVFFPQDALSIGKEFWQHTGLGISSRLAEHTLSILAIDPCHAGQDVTPPGLIVVYPKAYHELELDRQSPLSGSAAKRDLRHRIAIAISRTKVESEPCTRAQDISEDDVFLQTSGMTAIWAAHDLALAIRPPAKSVCFGFPYTDTLKILQKWGPGCHFLGSGLDSNIDELETLLERESVRNPNTPPILALFTEFPSNPLLRSPNLLRLRALADKYDFLIIVDDTVGTFVNVDLLPYADIVVTSLTKYFSGAANVLGGSLVLNPTQRHYGELKAHLDRTYEDNFFDEDAICLERNSRDFWRRMEVMNRNAEMLCEFFHSRSIAAGVAPHTTVIRDVLYPKYVTKVNFEQCQRKAPGQTIGIKAGDSPTSGFGALFSLVFTSIEASRAFFNALDCWKGPSLGANYTMAIPFTVLAYYTQLEWAKRYGVEEGLVRISVGLENPNALLEMFQVALNASSKAALVRPRL